MATDTAENEYLDIQFVTGYSNPSDVIKYGGSPTLGPSVRVHQSLVAEFSARMRGAFGGKFQDVHIAGRTTRDGPPPTLEETWDAYQDYLLDEETWSSCEPL